MDRDQLDCQPLQMWGGLECTVNRVGDRYFDQIERNGHSWRITDLDLFANLGLKALRYPILWERTASDGLLQADWSWADERLNRLRELDLRPIIGLIHHGSGPRDTDLLDPQFPERLAEYAGAVARRYPWVEDYTPVNEPLTTARFSALYGYWYPHGRDDSEFARALIGQCRAVVLSMRAIRVVNPSARLVQTDDLGKTYSTPDLAYQAEFENERRWITFDLLTGGLTPDSPMWDWLRWKGILEEELFWFLDNPCPPDIVGINHYLSSERFLDERVERYPGEHSGSNGQHTYVDVLAARILPEGAAGPQRLLMETWDRFHLPIAVTEVHNGCTREEQIRWLDEVWKGADGAKRAGADVRAVTVWSLLGAYDWHRMVTKDEGRYEPGVFDLQAPKPRPTAIARMVHDLAKDGRHDHPVLAVPGWWRRPDRFTYDAEPADASLAHYQSKTPETTSAAPILLVGTNGSLTRALIDACAGRGLPLHVVDRNAVDLTDSRIVDQLVEGHAPWAVIDLGDRDDSTFGLAGSARVASAMSAAATNLAVVSSKRDLQLLLFSSDRVFDGNRDEIHGEHAQPRPTDAIGRWWLETETMVLAAHPFALIVRTGPLFGRTDESDSIAEATCEFTQMHDPRTARQELVSPSYIPDLVQVALDYLIDGETGIWHLANKGSTTRDQFIRRAAAMSGLAPGAESHDSLEIDCQEPSSSRALASERGWNLPPWEDALARWISEIQRTGPQQSGETRALAREAQEVFSGVDDKPNVPVLTSKADDIVVSQAYRRPSPIADESRWRFSIGAGVRDVDGRHIGYVSAARHSYVLVQGKGFGDPISYAVPYDDVAVSNRESVRLAVSQASLEISAPESD